MIGHYTTGLRDALSSQAVLTFRTRLPLRKRRIPLFDRSMTTPAEAQYVFECVGVLWVVKAAYWTDMVDVRFLSEFIPGLPAQLAGVAIPF